MDCLRRKIVQCYYLVVNLSDFSIQNIIIKHLKTIVLLFVSFRLSAQQSVDIINYSAPANWRQQQEASSLTLEKVPESIRPCKIIIYKSEAASGKGTDDFRSQWNKYVRDLYTNVNDSITIETDRVGEWMVYSTISTLYDQ